MSYSIVCGVLSALCCKVTATTPAFQAYYSRLRVFLIWYIDGANFTGQLCAVRKRSTIRCTLHHSTLVLSCLLHPVRNPGISLNVS